MATDNDAEFLVGSRVCPVGLASKPELNGAFGTVASFNPDKGRYDVRFTLPSCSKSTYALLPERLESEAERYARVGVAWSIDAPSDELLTRTFTRCRELVDEIW